MAVLPALSTGGPVAEHVDYFMIFQCVQYFLIHKKHYTRKWDFNKKEVLVRSWHSNLTEMLLNFTKVLAIIKMESKNDI